jgi:hypothetical protein
MISQAEARVFYEKPHAIPHGNSCNVLIIIAFTFLRLDLIMADIAETTVV